MHDSRTGFDVCDLDERMNERIVFCVNSEFSRNAWAWNLQRLEEEEEEEEETEEKEQEEEEAAEEENLLGAFDQTLLAMKYSRMQYGIQTISR